LDEHLASLKFFFLLLHQVILILKEILQVSVRVLGPFSLQQPLLRLHVSNYYLAFFGRIVGHLDGVPRDLIACNLQTVLFFGFHRPL